MIDERLEAYHQNPDLDSPWEDVLKRIVGEKWASFICLFTLFSFTDK